LVIDGGRCGSTFDIVNAAADHIYDRGLSVQQLLDAVGSRLLEEDSKPATSSDLSQVNSTRLFSISEIRLKSSSGHDFDRIWKKVLLSDKCITNYISEVQFKAD